MFFGRCCFLVMLLSGWCISLSRLRSGFGTPRPDHAMLVIPPSPPGGRGRGPVPPVVLP